MDALGWSKFILFTLLFVVLLIGMLAGGLLVYFWPEKPTPSGLSHPIVDKNIDLENLELLKKDYQDRQRLANAGTDWNEGL